MQKEYVFNGWENVGNIRPVSKKYKGIDNPCDLYDILTGIWCADTCAPRLRNKWSTDNRTVGQCSVTSFLAQDIFGGEVYAMSTDNGGVHCYNCVNGIAFDLTSEQYGDEAGSLVYDKTGLQDREDSHHFAKEEKRARYNYLVSMLEKMCK